MSRPRVVIIGTGPAALVAAHRLVEAGAKPDLYERRSGPGWKLLVAGSSGLNVSHGGDEKDLPSFYTARSNEMKSVLQQFTRENWLNLLHFLGEETFLGTSRRYFLTNKKASSLLKKWTETLEAEGAKFHYGDEWLDFAVLPSGEIESRFASGSAVTADALLLALGSPSWETAPPVWPQHLSRRFGFTPFRPANAGYALEASPEFYAAAEGKPIKGLRLTTSRGEKLGECMITRYGLEGTPVYSVGTPGEAWLDLKPDVNEARLVEKLTGSKHPLRDAKLSEGARLVVEHLGNPDDLKDGARLAHVLKKFPIRLGEPRPLSECISAAGGIHWDELNERLELRKAPGVFCAGEMVDWDAPTGGFLLQASVSMGFVAAGGALSFLAAHQSSGERA